jgi:adenosylcobinamide kinase / adenosylcobinamide-phosphate guanylyltransferase
VILLLGGARSGKSHYAQELAVKTGQKVLFVATAEAGDEDMRLRIEKHQRSRPSGWRTLEAPDHLGSRIVDEIGDAQVVVVDCITLLVNNIFCRYDEKQFEGIDASVLEQQVLSEVDGLRACFERLDADFIIVSNEVGLGLVPDNRLGRLYRDILGRANQALAACSSEVYLMVSGIPLRLKPQKE